MPDPSERPDLAGALTDRLRNVIDPELGLDIVELGMVTAVSVGPDGHAAIEIALTTAACPLRGQIERDATQAALSLEGVDTVTITMGQLSPEAKAALMDRARRSAQRDAPSTSIPAAARIIGIASGKGGVGKSSVTANLAVALAQAGHVVGVLDADIWGFSIPRLLGLDGPVEAKAKKMVPKSMTMGSGEVRVLSMGFLAGEDTAIMWRGLILSRAVQQFVEDADWSGIEYLLIDLPPGTGDIQMSLARLLPRTELLLVTTPALAAQNVAARAGDMARRGALRVAGVIENMSAFTCDPGTTYALFGEGGGQRLADSLGVELLAQIPIDPALAAGGDIGQPVAGGDLPVSRAFGELARHLIASSPEAIEMTGCSARILELLDQAVAADR